MATWSSVNDDALDDDALDDDALDDDALDDDALDDDEEMRMFKHETRGWRALWNLMVWEVGR